jgi:anion-transporting  ArsA/GET3 family ATPase
MVRSSNTTAFLVTIPEGLGVSQTERIRHDFERFGIHIVGLIVNTLITERSVGDSLLLSKRKGVQEKYIQILEEQYSETFPIAMLPLQEYEVKGIEALKQIKKELYS